jgi:branched-chain amino acid transport system permease protein
MEIVIQNLLNGISVGMVLFLISAGLSQILGLMGIVNLTHGALFMIGGFVGWTIAVKLGSNYGLAILLGGIAAGMVGLIIERGLLRYLYKRLNQQVMITIGFIYILTNLSLWLWGGLPRSPYVPSFLSGSLTLINFKYPTYRFFIIGIGFIICLCLWWLQEKTRVGAIIRAGMDDKIMTTSLGINLDRVNYLVFFFGAFIAGVAGVIGAQMLGVHLDMAWDILLMALIVLVIGGEGSVQGALAGALIIGLVDAFGRTFAPEFAMFFMYIIMIIVLLVKPAGILPRSGG